MPDSGSITPTFLGADDDVVALEKAYDILPVIKAMPAQNGEPVLMILDSIEIEEINQTGHWWRAVGKYKYDSNQGFGGSASGMADENTTGQPEDNILEIFKINFQIGGGTKHITKSISTVATALIGHDPVVPPELRGAIGASKDGIAGTDVPDNALLLQITAYYRPSFVGMDFVATLKSLVAKANSNPSFLGQGEAEVVLLGVTGGISVLDVTPLTFEFSIKETITNQPDPGFVDLSMEAHDILDYAFERQFDPDAGNIQLSSPIYRYVHKVIPKADMAPLGFGIPAPE